MMNRFTFALAIVGVAALLAFDALPAACENVSPTSLTGGQPATLNAAAGAKAPVQTADLAVVHLNNGDFAIGDLSNCDDPKLLRWNCPVTTQPFDFLLSAVSGVYFPERKE